MVKTLSRAIRKFQKVEKTKISMLQTSREKLGDNNKEA